MQKGKTVDMKQMLSRALLGSGMAGQAADASTLYPQYQEYAINAQSSGEQPIPFEQWAAEFMGKQMPMQQQGPKGTPPGGMPM